MAYMKNLSHNVIFYENENIHYGCGHHFYENIDFTLLISANRSVLFKKHFQIMTYKISILIIIETEFWKFIQFRPKTKLKL